MPFDANYSHSYGGKPAGKQKKAGTRKPKAAKKMKRKSMKQIFGK